MLGFEKFLVVSPITAISTLLVVFLGIIYYALKDKGLLPGPRGLPFFGYWPFLREETTHLQLQEKMKKYGDVFSFTAFGQLYIHLGTIQAVKEAHVTKADCFSQRDTDFNALTLLFNEGVICANGEAWKTLRKFFVQSFREFGLTSMKDYMAGPIYDSVNGTIDDLKATGGKPVNVINSLNDRCSAVMRRMLFNDDGITKDELGGIMEAYEKTFSLFTSKRLLLSGEFARRVIFPLYSDYKCVLETHTIVKDILKKVIKRHEERFNEDSVQDVIDSYIKEKKDRSKRNDPTFHYFTEDGLISSLLQFVGDGILSVALFIGYFILCLLEYPEEQEKIYKELEEVVGHDRQPTLEDKNKLPYTIAFMQEGQRTMEFFSIFPALRCTKEFTHKGHIIPKGAITLINFWACHHDPNVFENPNEFRPSRFLTGAGKSKQELPILFGVGKRSCAGESYTMMIIFLFLTSIVKNFKLTKAEGYDKSKFTTGSLEVCAHPRG